MKARGIERIATAYVVAGWLLIQGASIVFPTFGAPAWALKLFILAAFAFFPIVIWIAWIATPAPHAIRVHAAGRWTRGDFVLLSLMAVIILISLAQFVLPSHMTASGPRPATSPSVAEASIAVLPFENLSSEKDTGYFADGIQDEILTRLANIRALKVISRTSTQQFASRPGNLRDIARQLGVANILEGSVQKSGDKVRINVQLIRAVSDDHIWAEIYDRRLDDVFSVESDVAGAIANALAARITPTERAAISVRPTTNALAYDDYLRGLAAYRENTDPGLSKAIRYLGQAVQQDPNYVQAWALLSRVNAYHYFGDGPRQAREGALSALSKALSLNSRSSDVVLAQGYYLYYVDLDYEAALRQFEIASRISPNDADVLSALGVITRRLGQWAKSRQYFQRAVAVDPLNKIWRRSVETVLVATHDYATASRYNDENLKRWPNDIDFMSTRILLLFQSGKVDQAKAAFAGTSANPAMLDATDANLTFFWLTRQFKEGVRYVQGAIARARASGGATDAVPVDLILDLGDFQRLAGDSSGAKVNYLRVLALSEAELKARPDNAALLANESFAYAGLGDRKNAEAKADRAMALKPASKDALEGFNYEDNRVRIAARFNDRERALPMLKRLLVTPSFLSPAILRLDPDFDALRGDPRFQKLEYQRVTVYQ